MDDNCILAHEILFPTEGSVTLLTGFRVATEIYTTMNGIVSVDIAYGFSTLPWPDQRSLLREATEAAKAIMERLPPELQTGSPDDLSSAFDYDADLQYVPPGLPNGQVAHDVRHIIKTDPARRRQLQYDIQKANIVVSQLATRSYFVETYFNLRDVHVSESQQPKPHADKDEEDERIYALMAEERELIVQDLLAILRTISQRNIEPNGGSLVNKIRQVASTLLEDPIERKGAFAIKSEEALEKVVDIMVKLEKAGPAGGEGENMTAQDEDEELQAWGELRDYQTQFAANGGFTGDI